MMLQPRHLVRQAERGDLPTLAHLLNFGDYVHRHLDYRAPLDWLGFQPFLLLEQRHFNSKQVAAALACPPDPPGIAWVRMYTAANQAVQTTAWEVLWPTVVQQLAQDPVVTTAAAIPMQPWFEQLLLHSGFSSDHNIVMLAWERQALPPLRPVPALSIRPINLKDLPVVEQIDRAAFMPVWQNSQDSLEQALRQSAFSTLAEINGAPVGYQISTTTAGGSHLARLAVLPAYQGRGVGFALLRHMLEEMAQRGARTVTVNTQANNAASLRLYEGIGFMRTGEAFPVYQTPIGGRLAAPAG